MGGLKGLGLLVQSGLGTGEEERKSVEETTQWRDGEQRKESVSDGEERK